MTTKYRDVSWVMILHGGLDYSLHLNPVAFSRQTDPQLKHEEKGENVVPNLEAHFTRLPGLAGC